MDDSKNLIMAIVLSSLVMMVYMLFFAPKVDPANDPALTPAPAVDEAPAIESEPLKSREAVVSTGQRVKIDTPQLSGSFLVEGSRFDDIQLKNYKKTLAEDSPNLTLLTPQGAEKAAYIFDNWTASIGSSGANTPWQLVSGDTLTPDKSVVMAYDAGGFKVTRTVSVDENFLITLDDQVTNTSSQEISITRVGVSRQHGLPNDLTNFFILQEGPISILDSKLDYAKYKKLRKEKTITNQGAGGWVALTDKYWLSAAIAPQGKPMTANFNYRLLNDVEVYEASYALDPVTLTPNATINSVGHIFAGAKDRNILIDYEDNIGIDQMELAIDYGRLRLLTQPMTLVLSKFGHWLGNFGLGIMLLTLIIKIVLFPLFNKQYASQAKMKKVQPKLKKIQTLYKDDRMKLQQEMMALYRKEGVNPAAGCLPIIPTIFVFFSLYKCVFINVELRHAPFFGWIQDLSARDPLSILNGFGLFPWGTGTEAGMLSFLAIGPLAILYGVSMSLIYTLTPQTAAGGGSEQAEMMAKMMKWMPWIFMFVLAPFAAGLLVYWVWNNILSFAQQYYITRKFKVDTPVDAFFRKLKGQDGPKDA